MSTLPRSPIIIHPQPSPHTHIHLIPVHSSRALTPAPQTARLRPCPWLGCARSPCASWQSCIHASCMYGQQREGGREGGREGHTLLVGRSRGIWGGMGPLSSWVGAEGYRGGGGEGRGKGGYDPEADDGCRSHSGPTRGEGSEGSPGLQSQSIPINQYKDQSHPSPDPLHQLLLLVVQRVT